MMNRIGKVLVLVNTAVSIVALSWAVGVFFRFTDWGWKEARLKEGWRIPSEYDKRTAAFKEGVKARDIALSGLVRARAAWRDAEDHFADNHLFYVADLTRLQSSQDPIEAKYIDETGKIVLDTPGKSIGKPVLKEKVAGIAKSYDSYLRDLKKINEDIDKEVKEIMGWTAKEREVTFILNGKDDLGKVQKNTVGIYSLLDAEKKAQDEARAEKEYLQPIWARARQEAELLVERRAGLQETLERLGATGSLPARVNAAQPPPPTRADKLPVAPDKVMGMSPRFPKLPLA
jgi:hypothetical protein